MSARRILRIGKMPRWQRWSIYLALLCVAITGIGWFVVIDALNGPPSQARFWWVSHGTLGWIALLAVGISIGGHVPATLRARRNLWAGLLTLGLAAGIVASTILLLYGPESSHDAVHWIHVGIGLAGVLIFPCHVFVGRRSIGRVGRSHHG